MPLIVTFKSEHYAHNNFPIQTTDRKQQGGSCQNCGNLFTDNTLQSATLRASLNLNCKDPSSNDTIDCCCYVFFSCKHCPYNQKIQLHDISCLFTPIHCSRHFKPDLQNLEDQTHCHSSEVWINKRECVMLNTAGEVGDVNNGWQTT